MNVDKIFDKLVDVVELLSTKLTEVAKEYGPDLIDTALMVIRLDGGSEIFYGFLLLTISFLVIKFVALPAYKKCIETDWECVPSIPITIIGFAVAILLAIPGMIQAFSFWSWVALIEPKYYVAHKIVDKVISETVDKR